MIFAILFAFGALLLLVQALRIAFSLIKLAVLLVVWCGCFLAVTVTGGLYLGDKLVRWFKVISEPEPVVTIYADEVDGPTIELPRDSFRTAEGLKTLSRAARSWSIAFTGERHGHASLAIASDTCKLEPLQPFPFMGYEWRGN
jgi:hypothetical protein